MGAKLILPGTPEYEAYERGELGPVTVVHATTRGLRAEPRGARQSRDLRPRTRSGKVDWGQFLRERRVARRGGG